VFETPSPSQTFVRAVEVAGASLSAEGPFVPLASGELAIHETDGDVTALTLAADAPEVRWVRLRLSGGIDVQTERSFLSFSEIIGVGAQQEAPMAETFDGVFSGRGVKLELAQDGAVVSGCYDGESRLSGTVQGAVLRALGESPAGIPSQFILVAAGDGAIRGLRSTNGAPFKPYDGAASTKPATCLAPEPPKLGCGAIVHGIGFDFDSDRITAGQPAPDRRPLRRAERSGRRDHLDHRPLVERRRRRLQSRPLAAARAIRRRRAGRPRSRRRSAFGGRPRRGCADREQ
jgi:OOP family OmpA-OmpF porin